MLVVSGMLYVIICFHIQSNEQNHNFGGCDCNLHKVFILYHFDQFVGHRSQGPPTKPKIGSGHGSQQILPKPDSKSHQNVKITQNHSKLLKIA